MALNRTFFAVMDERTGRDKSLVICKVDGDEGNTVKSVRCGAEKASLYLAGQAMSCGSWDELETALKMQQHKGGNDVL